MNFPGDGSVELSMNGVEANRENEPKKPAAVGPFRFGVRRYAATGPRRLFVPQKAALPPVFEPDSGRPWRSLLRVICQAV